VPSSITYSKVIEEGRKGKTESQLLLSNPDGIHYPVEGKKKKHSLLGLCSDIWKGGNKRDVSHDPPKEVRGDIANMPVDRRESGR